MLQIIKNKNKNKKIKPGLDYVGYSSKSNQDNSII